MLKLLRISRLQWMVYAVALLPLALLIFDALTNRLSVNPIQDATLRTGKAALLTLLASLACTPLNTLFGWRAALKVRRGLGLIAFLYAAIHFTIFIAVDYGFDVQLVWLELAEKRYVLVGAAALLILLLLAVTSTRGWQRRLGKRWKSLHRWVYVAGVLAILHYVWVQKADIRQPAVWGALLLTLLLLRVRRIRTALAARRKSG